MRGSHRAFVFSDLAIRVFLVLFAMVCLLPFWYVLTVSFSDPLQVREGQVMLWPKGLSTDAYRVVFNDAKFFTGFRVSVLRTLLGTAIALSAQCMMAYAISRTQLYGRKLFLYMVVFAILFNGGIIPTYLTVCYTGIFDTIWALVLPMALSPWNVIILTSFFSSLPASLEESAVIDGANDLVIFARIALPLSIPAVATIALFIAVNHWNNLMDAVIYINSSRLKPLQSYLIDLVMRASTQEMVSTSEQDIPTLSLQMAAVFASTLPILVVYPFLQRYFVKGVMIGAIKG